MVLLLSSVTSLHAGEGVLEINQACAVSATGCFSGDTALFPVSITFPGSYILTSNLVVPDSTTTAIEMFSSSVHIDLNGFEITRVGCEGAWTDCTPQVGGGFGVHQIMGSGASVRNGTITGMGEHGVKLAEGAAHVSGLHVRWNRGVGIATNGGRSILAGNVVSENGEDGIVAGPDSTIWGNVLWDNGTRGAGFGIAGYSYAYHDNIIRSQVTATRGTVGPGLVYDTGGNLCNGDTTCP